MGANLMFKICVEPGCQRLCKGPRCRRHAAEHKAKADRAPGRRDDPARRVRSTAKWKRVRKAALRRDDNQCTYGLEERYWLGRCPVTEQLDGHHRIPINAGGAPYDIDNVRTTCSAHHAVLEAAARNDG